MKICLLILFVVLAGLGDYLHCQQLLVGGAPAGNGAQLVYNSDGSVTLQVIAEEASSGMTVSASVVSPGGTDIANSVPAQLRPYTGFWQTGQATGVAYFNAPSVTFSGASWSPTPQLSAFTFGPLAAPTNAPNSSSTGGVLAGYIGGGSFSGNTLAFGPYSYQMYNFDPPEVTPFEGFTMYVHDSAGLFTDSTGIIPTQAATMDIVIYQTCAGSVCSYSGSTSLLLGPYYAMFPGVASVSLARVPPNALLYVTLAWTGATNCAFCSQGSNAVLPGIAQYTVATPAATPVATITNLGEVPITGQPDDYNPSFSVQNIPAAASTVKPVRTSKGVVMVNRGDLANVSRFEYLWGASGSGWLYRYMIDTTGGLARIRLSASVGKTFNASVFGQPKGWNSGAAGWYAAKGPEYAMDSSFSLQSTWAPGLMPIFLQSDWNGFTAAANGGALKLPPKFFKTADNEAVNRAVMIPRNSSVKFAIGPVFPHGATQEWVMDEVKGWVEVYGFAFLQPLLDATNRVAALNQIHPANQLESDIVDCLRRVIH